MEAYRKKITDETGHRFNNSASVGVHNIYLQTWLNFGILSRGFGVKCCDFSACSFST